MSLAERRLPLSAPVLETDLVVASGRAQRFWLLIRLAGRAGQLRGRDEIAMIHTREYGWCWTVADQADQPSLQLTCCRRCD